MSQRTILETWVCDEDAGIQFCGCISSTDALQRLSKGRANAEYSFCWQFPNKPVPHPTAADNSC